MQDIFQYKDYKEFLNNKLDEKDGKGRGARAQMSRAIGCQTAYTAQVLRGLAHFSLEQGEAINEYLGHTENQGTYFLLLIQYAKAGTPQLTARFAKQISKAQEGHSILKNRLEINEKLAEHDQMIYYSSWIYGAIHALVSIPQYQKTDQIAKYLGLEQRKVSEILEFLLSSGLLEKNIQGDLQIAHRQIHLGSDSPLISKHHLNWRLQAMKAIESNPMSGLHYSSIITISKKDEKIIRENLIEMIKNLKPIIRDSKEEELCCLSFDFFEIKN